MLYRPHQKIPNMIEREPTKRFAWNKLNNYGDHDCCTCKISVYPRLRQLLHDCGIGVSGEGSVSSEGVGSVVSQHRALLFCQYKSMLDIIEKDLFKWVQGNEYRRKLFRNEYRMSSVESSPVMLIQRSLYLLITHALCRVHMPSVTYLRLDGSVPAGNRHAVVQK